MTTAYTSLLGLALPVDGELTGTWGQVVNNYITTYLDGAIAGTQIISGSQTAVTLSKTTGTALIQVGSGATGSSQYQIIRCSGNPGGSTPSLLTITAPATDKTYLIINATSNSQSVKIVNAGPTTGVTIASGKTSIVAWNGSDFVEISPSTATSATTATTATAANGINSATTTIVLNGATAPTTGQVLTATSGTAATWQTPTVSGGTVTSVAALTLGTSGTDVSSTVANSTTTPVITLNLPTASATNRGALSAADWTTFNGKLPTTGGTMTGAITFAASQTVDGTNPIGYKNIPQTGSDKTTAYTLTTGDVGKYVGVGTSGSIVVPTSTFANGDAISVFNNTTGNITITTSAPTAYIGGTNTVKTSITLATRGIATILFISATVCVVTGNVS